jgi:hypothetical protein
MQTSIIFKNTAIPQRSLSHPPDAIGFVIFCRVASIGMTVVFSVRRGEDAAIRLRIFHIPNLSANRRIFPSNIHIMNVIPNPPAGG